jgi:hypothetical protein
MQPVKRTKVGKRSEDEDAELCDNNMASVCFGYVGGGGVGLRWLLGYVMKAEAIVVVVVVVVVRWRHWANDHGSNCSIRYYRSSWHKRR